MALEIIGTANRSYDELEQPESGVRFRIPYNDNGYDITLSNEEIDQLLGIGLARLHANDSLSAGIGFDGEVRLPDGELPIYIGLKGIETHGENGHKQDVGMSLVAVTQSVVYEHRGILDTRRQSYNGLWQYIGYQALPPLKEPEVPAGA